MKFSAATVIFSILTVSSALPHQVERKDALSEPLPIVKRQVPVEVASMKVGDVIVPFAPGGPGGNNKKREAQPVRRQVPVEVASMKVGGVIVPFAPGGPAGNGGAKN